MIRGENAPDGYACQAPLYFGREDIWDEETVVGVLLIVALRTVGVSVCGQATCDDTKVEALTRTFAGLDREASDVFVDGERTCDRNTGDEHIVLCSLVDLVGETTCCAVPRDIDAKNNMAPKPATALEDSSGSELCEDMGVAVLTSR